MYRRAAQLLPVLTALAISYAADAPIGTTLELRFRQEVNSYSSSKGDPVEAVVIAPLQIDGVTLIPAGTLVHGSVEHVQRVGVGFVRETASLRIQFSSIEFADGFRLPINALVTQIDNARERVDKTGKVRGIRSTNTPGFRAAGLLTSLAAVDPIALAFSTAAFASLLRFSEPEIRLVAGAELYIKLTSKLPLDAVAEAAPPPSGFPKELLPGLPYRTKTASTGELSDMTNLLFVGSRDAMERAFLAAGWQPPEPLTSAARYRTLRAIAENQEYKAAPMSTLLLDGAHPSITLAKGMNTFSKRHHLRIYDLPGTWQGQPMYTAAATQDIGISLSGGRLIHVIDDHIDRERAKVQNDLLFTGCVSSAETVERPWLPASTKNATGQALATDRSITIVVFNDCQAPHSFDEAVSAAPGPYRGNRMARIGRQTVLTFRNDIYRNSIWYQGVSIAVQTGQQYLKGRSHVRETHGPMISAPRVKEPRLSGLPWVPPQVELGFHAGAMVFSHSTLGGEGLFISRRSSPHGPPEVMELRAANRISPGFALGGTVTLNTYRWVSHELGFGYQRGNLQMDLAGVSGVVEQRSGFLTRQFTYNAVLHLRPRESRVRPYFLGGPALQLVHLTEAPFVKAGGVFRFGLSNVGAFRAAYNFGSAAPLEGGGIFQAGLQMGVGVKIRATEHWMVRVDYRNTCSPPPDLLRRSLEPQTLPDKFSHGKVAQQRLTVGFAFTF